ncbi:MAG: biotin attachment protein [Planctomycetia bacterium]|nr:biotin attachment protein [Planctomycetia bacterium]
MDAATPSPSGPSPDPRPPADQRLVVPDLGHPGVRAAVSLWLVPEGALVVEGDRVVELVAGGATLDLEAPVTGCLVRQWIDEDAEVAPGDVLAAFRADEGAAPA